MGGSETRRWVSEGLPKARETIMMCMYSYISLYHFFYLSIYLFTYLSLLFNHFSRAGPATDESNGGVVHDDACVWWIYFQPRGLS